MVDSVNSTGPTKGKDNAESILLQARQARAAGELLKSHALYVRASELAPQNAAAWAGRADTAINPDEAISAWGHVQALDPNDPDAPFLLQGQLQNRLDLCEPGEGDSLVPLGHLLAELGLRDEANRVFVRATELNPQNGDAWVWRAGVAGDLQETIRCLNQALAVQPGNEQALKGLEWARAEAAGKPALTTPARTSSDIVAEGLALLKTNDRQGAHRKFVRAAELDQRNETAWLWRASTTADIEEAIACVDQALAVDPNNEAARQARTWLRVRKLRDGAKTFVPHAFARAPGQSSPPPSEAAPSHAWMAILAVMGILSLIVLAAAIFLLGRALF